MFKQAFRVAFVALIWKQYKAVIVSTLLLFLYLYLVSWIHADYVASAQLQGETKGLGESFIIKWIALAGGVSAYALFHFLYHRVKQLRKEHVQAVTMPKVKKPAKTTPAHLKEDPFAEIRERKKLRGRKEFEGE